MTAPFIDRRAVARYNVEHVDQVTEVKGFAPWVKPGTLVALGRNWYGIVTPAALACDCGKASLCPYVLQFRLVRLGRGANVPYMATVPGFGTSEPSITVTGTTRKSALDKLTARITPDWAWNR